MSSPCLFRRLSIWYPFAGVIPSAIAARFAGNPLLIKALNARSLASCTGRVRLFELYFRFGFGGFVSIFVVVSILTSESYVFRGVKFFFIDLASLPVPILGYAVGRRLPDNGFLSLSLSLSLHRIGATGDIETLYLNALRCPYVCPYVYPYMVYMFLYPYRPYVFTDIRNTA